jgi:threonine synthase
MDYLSSRGGCPPVSAAEAIVAGLAPDGGLYVPGRIARLDPDEIPRLCALPYGELATSVLGAFLDGFSREEVAACVASAYTVDKFGAAGPAPLRLLDSRTALLELWHGPTSAFKDIALQILPHLMTVARRKAGKAEDLVILVATSGDTGKAALEGFRDVAGTRVVVFYPEGGVSEVQRLQMLTQEGGNVHVLGVRGADFDAAQSGVKAILADGSLRRGLSAKGLALSSANSINWGRLLPQVCYYFSAYGRLVAGGAVEWGGLANVAVPTGNFGNILAAWYAREMGLPLGRLVCASNSNDVLSLFLHGGAYDRNRALLRTMSPSMDIVVSSNLERLLFELAGHDPGPLRRWMEALGAEGRYAVDARTMDRVRSVFWGGSCSEEETLASIASTWRDHGCLIDTHTAVAVKVLGDYREETGDSAPAIVASTASPFKFNRDVARAVFGEAAVGGKGEFELLDLLSLRCGLEIPKGLKGLRGRPRLHGSTCTPEGMRAAVADLLGA